MQRVVLHRWVLMVIVVALSLSAEGCRDRAGTTGAAAHAGPSMISASPADRRAALAAPYRLSPDRRFLLAVQEVRRLVLGGNTSEPVVLFQDGGWLVRAYGAEVGRLPETPSFADALRLCVDLARTLEKQKPLAIAASPGLPEAELPFDEEAFTALGHAEAAWASGPSQSALHEATGAMVAIAAQMTDTLGVADDVTGRALAALAVDKAFGGAPTVRLEAMLAEAMDYRADARAVAATLSRDDVVRAYVARDDAALSEVARTAGASSWAKYLLLRRLLERNDDSGEAAWRKEAFHGKGALLPILGARLACDDFANWRELGVTMPPLVLLHTGRAAKQKDAEDAWHALRLPLAADDLAPASARAVAGLAVVRGGMLARFDADAAKLAGTPTSAFARGTVTASYLRAYMLTAIDTEAHFELDMLSSAPAGRNYLDEMKPPVAKESNDFRSWFSVSVALDETGKVDPALAQLGAASSLGGAPRMRLFAKIEKLLDWSDPSALAAAKQLAQRLDSRPQQRELMGNIAWGALSDLRLAEKYYRAAVEAAPRMFGETEVWLAGIEEDEVALRAAVKAPELSPAQQLDGVVRLENIGKLDPAAADREIDGVLARSHDDWNARALAAEHLAKKGRHEHTRAIALDWLTRHAKDPGLAPAFARSAVAESFVAEKRWSDALKAVELAVPSYAYRPLAITARMLARLGHAEDAETLAVNTMKRYPIAKAAALVAEVRWRAHDDAGAAAALMRGGVTLTTGDWQVVVGTVFADVFEDAPGDGGKALKAILAAGGPSGAVGTMATELITRKKYELALEVLQAPSSGAEQYRRILSVYGVLKTWKGEKPAREWLGGKLRGNPGFIAMFPFEAGQDDLLWDLTANADEKPEDLEFFHLLLAAAAVRAHPRDETRIGALRTWFDKNEGEPSRYRVLGRYLLGAADEAAATATAVDVKGACEVAYYMAVRAEAEGRIGDASDLYRTTVETTRVHDGEYGWALRQLRRWKGSGKSLTRLAATR